jgi:hypothetical protein
MKGSLWRALVLAAVAAAAFVGVAVAANTGGFTDATADAQTAPDISAVAISNDDTGLVSVKVTLVNRSLLNANDDLAIGIDTDQNPDTGSFFYGAEFELNLDRGTIVVWRDNPSGSYSQAPAPPSLRIVFTGGAVTFSFKASELGISSGFNLYALGVDASAFDAAPDMRMVNYQLVSGAAAPLVGRDTRAPVTGALKSKGTHGKIVNIDYFAADGRGETADTILVYRGKKVVKRFNFSIADTSPFLIYSARWKVSKKTKGKFRFCVTSTDRAGNKSKTSCAALTIK